MSQYKHVWKWTFGPLPSGRGSVWLWRSHPVFIYWNTGMDVLGQIYLTMAINQQKRCLQFLKPWHHLLHSVLHWLHHQSFLGNRHKLGHHWLVSSGPCLSTETLQWIFLAKFTSQWPSSTEALLSIPKDSTSSTSFNSSLTSSSGFSWSLTQSATWFIGIWWPLST